MKEIGSEFSFCSDEDYYFERIKKLGNDCRFLRCGRDAIGYIADGLNKKSQIILMPAYCCDSMIKPFIIKGWRVEYYPINFDLTVNVEYIIDSIKRLNPDAILLMNFYGISNSEKAVNIIRTNSTDIQIIEDVTHIIFDIDKIYSPNVNFYIGSIRKWMGITDGAIVISTKRVLPKIIYKENEFVTLRNKGLYLKEKYHHVADPTIKIMYRKVLSEAENSLSNGEIPYLISPSSLFILEQTNCSSIKNKRKWNISLLLNLLRTIPTIKFPVNIDLIYENTPFSLPIMIEKRDFIQNELAKKGIYCAVLWPLEEDARKLSKHAAEMERTMLSIPIDQRYDASDMYQIYKTIKPLLS